MFEIILQLGLQHGLLCTRDGVCRLLVTIDPVRGLTQSRCALLIGGLACLPGTGCLRYFFQIFSCASLLAAWIKVLAFVACPPVKICLRCSPISARPHDACFRRLADLPVRWCLSLYPRYCAQGLKMHDSVDRLAGSHLFFRWCISLCPAVTLRNNNAQSLLLRTASGWYACQRVSEPVSEMLCTMSLEVGSKALAGSSKMMSRPVSEPSLIRHHGAHIEWQAWCPDGQSWPQAKTDLKSEERLSKETTIGGCPFRPCACQTVICFIACGECGPVWRAPMLRIIVWVMFTKDTPGTKPCHAKYQILTILSVSASICRVKTRWEKNLDQDEFTSMVLFLWTCAQTRWGRSREHQHQKSTQSAKHKATERKTAVHAN